MNFSASDDNLANVFLEIGDDLLDVTEMQYYRWNTSTVDDGTRTVKVTAIDEAGNINSSSFTIWIDNTEPMLTLFSPSDGAFVAGSLNVEFSVSDLSPVNVNYALDDDALADITGRNSFNIDTAELGDGLHNLKFVITDAPGNSIENVIKIIVDNTLPYVDFDAPIDGSYLGDTSPIVLMGNDANFDRMELYISRELAEKWDTSRLNRYDWDTKNSEDGACILKAIAYDKAGNTMETSLIVRVDNTLPNVSIISPHQEIGVTGIYDIRFSALDTNLAKVFLHIDDDLSDVTGMNSYPWNTVGISDGKHMIRIRAVDKAGNVAEMQITVKTINQYLMIESIMGITVIALIISIWPSILASKHVII